MHHSDTLEQNWLFSSLFLNSSYRGGTGTEGYSATHCVLALGDQAFNALCLWASLSQEGKTGTLRDDLDGNIINA